MRLDVFNEATELYNKYRLCEEVLEYLSNEETVKGQKYKETLAKFADTFKSEFMMFVHERMTASGEAFEECGKCTCENCPVEEEPTTPTEPKEPKFAYGEKVEITNGDYKGKVGMVMGFDDTNATYYVVSPQFSMWFPESDLKAYEDESEEQPEQPTPPEDEDDKYEMVYGERVIVKSGEYAGMVGTIIDVMVGFTKVLVGLDDVEDAVEFTPDQLAKYTDPENTEENGGIVTPDEGE